jgi:hypothetical protein
MIYQPETPSLRGHEMGMIPLPIPITSITGFVWLNALVNFGP